MKDWNGQIDNTTDKFMEHFGSLTGPQLNWTPSADVWSIAQNIDHLIVINQSYFPAVSTMKSGDDKLPFIARFGFITSLFGKMILNSVKPDSKKKTKTFAIWEPAKTEISDDILLRFSQHQSDLKEAIERSKELIKAGAIISSPANRNIVYKLETAFDIIVTHEQRHLEQAKEVLVLLTQRQGH